VNSYDVYRLVFSANGISKGRSVFMNIPLSAIRRVRAECLLTVVKQRFWSQNILSVTLNPWTYLLFQDKGFSRSQVDHALDDLVELGQIRLIPSHEGVRIEPVSEGADVGA
jgi:hypothetical protein